MLLLKSAFAALAVVSLGALAQPAAPSPSLEALFQTPAIGSMAISPNGSLLATTLPGRNGQLELAVADLEQTPLQFKTLGWLKDYDVWRIEWLNDKRLIFTARERQTGLLGHEVGLWAVDPQDGEARVLIDPHWQGYRDHKPLSERTLSADWEFYDIPGDGSDDVLIALRGWSAFEQHFTYELFRMNTRSPAPRRLDEDAPAGTFAWVLDAQDKPAWLQAWQNGRRLVFQREGEGEVKKWTQRASFDAVKEAGWQPRLLVDGQLLVSAELPGADGSQLLLWDTARNAPGTQAVLRARGFDVGDNAVALIDRPARVPLGWRLRMDARYTRWTEPAMAQTQADIDRALPGRINEIVCSDCLKARRWLVRSLADGRSPRYSVLDRKTGGLRPLGSALPDLNDERLSQRSFHMIKARDGQALPVYLSQPAGDTAAGKPRAAVVYVAGRQGSRTGLEWQSDPVPQFLASRGYLVIEPDVRGSSGYGAAHLAAGNGQWGRAQLSDLEDALQWAIAQGLVDGKRVCIMGGSFEGIAALMAPIAQPKSYRCAIAWSAPVDLPRMQADLAASTRIDVDKRLHEYYARMIGAPEGLPSPLRQAAELRIPVLVGWGEVDPLIPIGQGRDFRAAARAAGVALEYVEYAGESHIWLKPETRVDFFGRAEKLLARALAN